MGRESGTGSHMPMQGLPEVVGLYSLASDVAGVHCIGLDSKGLMNPLYEVGVPVLEVACWQDSSHHLPIKCPVYTQTIFDPGRRCNELTR